MSERYRLNKAHPPTEEAISYPAPASGFISAARTGLVTTLLNGR